MAGHRCQTPQLLLLEGHSSSSLVTCKSIMEEILLEDELEERLVQWQRLPLEDATWENSAIIHQQFPTVDLEDKDPLNRGGNDRPRRSERVPRRNPKYMG